MSSSNENPILRFEFDAELLQAADDPVGFMFADMREAALVELAEVVASGKKVVATITTE